MRHDDRWMPTAATPLLAAVATALSYWVGTRVGLLLTPSGLAVSALWPPNAMLLAAMLLSPRRYWPWYVLAILPVHLAVQVSHGIPVTTSIGWFVTNTSEAVLGAFWLRRLRTARELFHTFVGVLLFLAIAVTCATGLTSFLDAAVVVMTGAGQGYWEVWRHRFMSNSLATLSLVPAIVISGASSFTHFRTVRRSRYLEGGLLALGTMFVVNLLFARQGQTQESILSLTYTVLPLMFWAAVRFGPVGVSLLQIVSTSAILWAALGQDTFSLSEMLSLQIFLLVLNGLSLSLAVVVRERRHFQSLHSAVLMSMRNAVAITDSEGIVIDANEAWTAATRRHDPGRLDGVALHANYLERHRAAATESPEAARLVAGLESVLAGTQKLFEMEYAYRAFDEQRWFSISVVPLWGEQRGAVVTHADITARKRDEAETLRLREELAHAGRVMTMGTLSAALTHELSQPLAAILGNAQAARRLCERKRSEDIAEVEVILADVVSASRRAGNILRRLRGWFSNGRQNMRQLGLNDVANDVIEILRSDLVRRGVSVVRRLGTGLPSIQGDRLQLQQVVLNLIQNACDAMRDNAPGDRCVTVTTALCDSGVRLSVEDIGTGIAPDQLGSVFEPFVTTKATGLGLGLALCKSIVHSHEGELTAENNRMRGVTFHCTLPSGDRQETAAVG